MNSRRFQLGLKLWSPNTNLLDIVNYLSQNNIIDYLELYIVPETYETSVKIWKKAKLPIIIHAPNESILSIGTIDRFTKNMQNSGKSGPGISKGWLATRRSATIHGVGLTRMKSNPVTFKICRVSLNEILTLPSLRFLALQQLQSPSRLLFFF